VNHRGSSGFGKAFEAAADRKQGREPLWDCVEARRFLSTLDFVDDSKIAIMGGSFGAYMTLAALAFHPDEFAAGVAISGVSNWIRALKALPEGSPTRKFYYEKLGDPETDEELLRAISPLFHARNISKPLMVLQGAKDPRVLRAESDDIVAAVRTNGGVVEYLLFDDEAHGFRKRANAVRAYQAILNFLDRHLKYDRSYENFGLEEYVIA
jgi:dipeptidyl aminopeptidase/acylaminoacyl peptidase